MSVEQAGSPKIAYRPVNRITFGERILSASEFAEEFGLGQYDRVNLKCVLENSGLRR